MKVALDFLSEWWPLIVIIAGGAAKVLNKITPHASSCGGLKRWLLIIVDILDIIKVTPAPVKPTPKTVNHGLFLFAFMSMLTLPSLNGCASTGDAFAKALATMQTAGDAAYTQIRPRYQERCLAAAKACDVKLEECQAYATCDAERHGVLEALRALQLGVSKAGEAVPKIKEVLR